MYDSKAKQNLLVRKTQEEQKACLHPKMFIIIIHAIVLIVSVDIVSIIIITVK